jgi:hypothetical protein
MKARAQKRSACASAVLSDPNDRDDPGTNLQHARLVVVSANLVDVNRLSRVDVEGRVASARGTLGLHIRKEECNPLIPLVREATTSLPNLQATYLHNVENPSDPSRLRLPKKAYSHKRGGPS